MNKSLALGSLLHRSYTAIELGYMSGIKSEDFLTFLKHIEHPTTSTQKVKGFFSYAHELDVLKERRIQDEIIDGVLVKIVRIQRILRKTPFVEGVWITGSLAVGNTHKNSDIDLLVATSQGRLFTARFFLLGVAKILGKKRNGNTYAQSKGKLCCNHFVDIAHMKLQETPNEYLSLAYKNFIPIYGQKKIISLFAKENLDWVEGRMLMGYTKFEEKKENKIENILKGRWGDVCEQVFCFIQKRHIQKQSKKLLNLHASRLVVEKGEVETQYNTTKTKDLLGRLTL